MKLTYYGTAAGEGWPGVFCGCSICQQARRLGGKNRRTRSQALVDEALLLDLPPDNSLHSLFYGLDLSRVEALLFTHSHSDHCYPEDLELLREPYSHTREPLQVFGNEAVADRVLRACGSLGGHRERFTYRTVREDVPLKVLDYEVLPLQAVHTGTERCLCYRIARNGKALLYAHDTGLLSQHTLEVLAAQEGKLGLVSLDCTQQQHRDGRYHMGFFDCVEQKERLLAAGAADEDTLWVVSHFSHNGGWLHDQLREMAEKWGFLAAWDTMSIEF